MNNKIKISSILIFLMLISINSHAKNNEHEIKMAIYNANQQHLSAQLEYKRKLLETKSEKLANDRLLNIVLEKEKQLLKLEESHPVIFKEIIERIDNSSLPELKQELKELEQKQKELKSKDTLKVVV